MNVTETTKETPAATTGFIPKIVRWMALHPFIAAEHLKGPFATVRPLPAVNLRSGDGTENSDFWSALGGQLKPGLDLVITATVDAAAIVEAGPPVQEIDVTATRYPGPVEVLDND